MLGNFANAAVIEFGGGSILDDRFDGDTINLGLGGVLRYFDPASVFRIQSLDSGFINYFGGGTSEIEVYNYTEVDVFGGYIGWLGAYGNSQTNVVSGEIGSTLLDDNAYFSLEGGSIGQVFMLRNSTLQLFGSSFSSEIIASERDRGVIYEVSWDGQQGEEITVNFVTSHGDPESYFTGSVLFNDTPFLLNGEPVTAQAVSEPATVGLICVGMIASAFRRSRKKGC